MIIAIILLALLVLGFFWTRLSAKQRSALRTQASINIRTLLTLGAILLLPASLLLPGIEPLVGWLLPATALALWGFLLMAYWSSQVVPAGALRRQTVPYRPHHAPLITSRDDTQEAAGGDVPKLFQWSFTPHSGRAEQMSLALALNSQRYESARAEERRRVGDWAHYAEKDMPELHALTAEFSRLHEFRNWSTLEQAANVLCFTQQCIHYRHDEETTPQAEWPRYPVETLMDEEGDCEDDVILTAAVLKRLGFDVALLYYPGHCALGVAGADGLPGSYVSHDGKDYFYGETTADGWHLGEAPEAYRGRRPDSVEVVKREVSS